MINPMLTLPISLETVSDSLLVKLATNPICTQQPAELVTVCAKMCCSQCTGGVGKTSATAAQRVQTVVEVDSLQA